MTKTLIDPLRKPASTKGVALLVVAALVVLTIGSYGAYRIWRHFHVAQVALTNATQNDFDFDGQGATVITGNTGEPIKGMVLVFHGYDSDERVSRMPYMAGMTQDLIDAGWAVASTEAGGDTWGGGETQNNYADFYPYLIDTYETSTVVAVSVSMGTVPALNLISQERLPGLAGWVGISPVTDLASMADMDDWSLIIADALAPDAVKRLSPVNLEYPQLPMAIVSAPGDTAAPPAEQVEPFAAKTGAHVTTCSGGHVDPDCFRASSVLDLVN